MVVDDPRLELVAASEREQRESTSEAEAHDADVAVASDPGEAAEEVGPSDDVVYRSVHRERVLREQRCRPPLRLRFHEVGRQRHEARARIDPGNLALRPGQA